MGKEILLVGTGPMAIEYKKVLDELKLNFVVIGRGKKSALKFQKLTGLIPHFGGLQKYLNENTFSGNTYAILATSIESLMPTLLSILKKGISKILIEKPGAISIEELIENEEKINEFKKEIYVAYNRRFYSSVEEVKKIISSDGGLNSMHFEFTEWAHEIEPLKKAKGVKKNWFFANSTHVIDLAFYLAGKPVEWQTYSKGGKIFWHSKTNFTGAGITQKGVLFSYISNWESAGRWSIELLTEKRRIYLKPLEKIMIQKRGTTSTEEHYFDNTYDLKFKPGLFHQTKCFMEDIKENLLTIEEHTNIAKKIYSIMN